MGAAPGLALDKSGQVEVLASMEAFVREEMEAHKERRNLWFPNELVQADADTPQAWDDALAEVRAGARDLPDEVRVAVALNLLTEEGLPHFHRLIAVHFGENSAWSDWNNMWTAEEDRHGCALRDYVRDARLFNMGELERLQYSYIEAGFNPEWEQDPYRLLAYTSLQEKATQLSHANTGRMASGCENLLQRVLAHLAGDESRHYLFYRAMFGEIIKRDPDRALVALQKIVSNFSMPGHRIAGFDDMSEVVRRANIFGARQFQRIVEELLDLWQIGAMTGLAGSGAEAQDKLMKVPARLERMSDYVDTKATKKTFRFAFAYNREIVI
jgi:acyl-[acyl-carrier-protein] desaturase